MCDIVIHPSLWENGAGSMNKRGMIWSHTGRQTVKVKDPGLEVLGPGSGDLLCPGQVSYIFIISKLWSFD